MERLRTITSAKGYFCSCILLFTIWVYNLQDVAAIETSLEASPHLDSPLNSNVTDPPESGIFYSHDDKSNPLETGGGQRLKLMQGPVLTETQQGGVGPGPKESGIGTAQTNHQYSNQVGQPMSRMYPSSSPLYSTISAPPESGVFNPPQDNSTPLGTGGTQRVKPKDGPRLRKHQRGKGRRSRKGKGRRGPKGKRRRRPKGKGRRSPKGKGRRGPKGSGMGTTPTNNPYSSPAGQLMSPMYPPKASSPLSSPLYSTTGLANPPKSGFIGLADPPESRFIDFANPPESGFGFLDRADPPDPPKSGFTDLADPPESGFMSIADPPESKFIDLANQPERGFIGLADPPESGFFDPISISPAVFPDNPNPGEAMSPMYPSFPTQYEPVLTGKCPVNFSSISKIIDKTASDCSAPLASLVADVICCPQFKSLLHIFQGQYSSNSNQLVLQKTVATDCFSDILSIIASRGGNQYIPDLCHTKHENLTGGSCPVKDVTTFEKMVDTKKLLDACSSVDPLKECCRPVCQPAIVDAALRISDGESDSDKKRNVVGEGTGMDVLNMCRGVVYSWLSRKLSPMAANNAFRMLSACKVNKVCPLTFSKPLEVIKDCGGDDSPSLSCCSTLNSYIADVIQKQMLITNKQAINCATLFGSMLKKQGIKTDLYELCRVDIKDFSLQAYGRQGCLLRSFPSDMVVDNVTGFGITCDLNDNIPAPWPSSIPTGQSLTLCAPEMSLPALPTKDSGNRGYHRSGAMQLLSLVSIFVFGLFL